MGCDIHLHVEIKVDGEWLYYSSSDIRRNYAVFSKMADVRNSNNEIKPIASPRGLPSNITKMTRLLRDNYGEDGHSDSWLSYEEYVDVLDWIMKTTKNTMYKYDFLGSGFFSVGQEAHKMVQ